jgi:repressor LexA
MSKPPANFVRIPTLISSFKCGSDSPLNEGIEYELVPEEAIKDIKEPYMLIAQGNSMEPTIYAGDRLIVDVHAPTLSKNIVAVYYNGDYIIKRFEQRGFSVYLTSDNLQYNDIKIKEDDDFRILGIVRELLRDL